MKVIRSFGLIALSSLVFACAGDPKEPPATPSSGSDVSSTEVSQLPDNNSDDAGDDPSRSQLNISSEIKNACGISDSEAYFAFNSANVRPQDETVLRKLATCFASGPLKDRRMQLVGHADPRGDEEYNMVLGGRRAENVKLVIQRLGLGGDRIRTSSRGELDATGTDEASYLRDRRVDVMLAD